MQVQNYYVPITRRNALKPVAFSGLLPQGQVIEKALLDAGVNKESLRKDWKVTLWLIHKSQDRITLFVDASQTPQVDLKALKAVFEAPLKGLGNVQLRLTGPSDLECCQRRCGGCLATPFEPELRQTWVE